MDYAIMMIMQTRHAKRTRKYGILMGLIFLLSGAFGALLTMHINVRPPDQ